MFVMFDRWVLSSVKKPGLIASLFGVATLYGCNTTDLVNVNGEPTVTQLATLSQVEQTPFEGDIVITRYASDPQGRFAIGITPMNGPQRPRALEIAEGAYLRMCGQASTGSGGTGEPGVGRLGTRAPYYISETRTYLIYMQCPGGR